jgi:hypothetical protein
MRHRNLAVIASILLASPAVFAQFRASIQGTVTDPTGAVISGATLTLTDLETNKTLTATSNASGTYNFSALAPDHYRLSSTAAGFTPQVIEDLRLNPEQANAVNVQMTVAGGPVTTVTVSGSSVANLDTETASINGSVDSNQIQHLPSAGRDVFQLVQLAPGVFGDGSQSAGGGSNNLPGTQGPGGSGNGIFATENGPQANANGGQYESNGISIDGISTVSAVWGGTSVITPTEDSVGNVKVVSNGYDAEEGRFSGAQVQITSKTGSNEYHGSLFFRANRPGLNAYQRFNGPTTFNPGTASARGLLRDTERANQEGGSVGGPILHNKIFAFFAYETQRDNSAVSGTGWYDTQAFDALAPTGSIAAKYLGFKGAQVAASSIVNETCTQAGFVEGTNCITVPGQGLNLGSPLKQALGTQDLSWKSTTNPGIGGGLDPTTADVALYNTVNPTSQVASQYNGRLDSDVTKNDHVAFAIYWVPLTTTDYNGTVRAYNLYHHEQTNDAYSIIWNHVFTPSFLNEARANDAGWRWNEILTNPQEPFGLPQSQVDGMANISGGSQLAFFGAPGPSNFDQHTYTYKDVATKIAGNHSIKFGGDVTRLYYLNNPTYSARPGYNFYNIWDFLNDAPHTESGSFDPATGTPTTNRQDTREDLYGFFIQDGWKALPNLTLNAGLRYSYFGPLSSKENNLNRVIFGSGADTYTDLYVRRGGNLTNAQKLNFGPQFGFSYSPPMLHGKGVLRGGFGLNFNQTEIAISGNAGGNPPNVLAVNYSSGSPTAIDPRIVYAVAANSSSLFGFPANPHAVGGFNAQNLPIAGGAFITAFQSTQPTVYTEHFSLDTQFDLGHAIVATAGYQGSLGRHIIVQSFSYVDAFAYGQAQNPLVQNVDFYGNTGNSSNNSLLLGLKHQMAHGFMFDAEFAYAKTMDTGSGPYFENPYPYAPGLAYGRSDFNYGKAFKLYGLWQPVFFHNNSLLSKIADGFSLSGIYNIHTGFPYTPTYNVPGGNLYYAASGYNSLRPAALLPGGGHNTGNSAFEAGKPNINFPLNQSLPGDATSSPYFLNPVAPIAGASGFAAGLPSMPGIGRNSFNGPGYQDVDGTLTKSFGLPSARIIGESAKIEIRADAFNLFNQTNIDGSKIVTNYLQQNFGQSTGGLAGRIVNLQARFSF